MRSLRGYGQEEKGGREGGGGRTGMLGRRVVGLPAIMRSSVFRCRSASPYRYVSSPSRSSPSSLPPATPPRPPTTHLAPLGDQMASPIRVIPNILFLFRNQISRRPSRSRRIFYDSLSLFLFLSGGHWWKSFVLRKLSSRRFDPDIRNVVMKYVMRSNNALKSNKHNDVINVF